MGAAFKMIRGVGVLNVLFRDAVVVRGFLALVLVVNGWGALWGQSRQVLLILN